MSVWHSGQTSGLRQGGGLLEVCKARSPPPVLPWDLGLGKYKVASLEEMGGSVDEEEMDVWYAAVRGMPWG